MKWLGLVTVLLLSPAAWAADAPATEQDKPILILGVGGTTGVANDPDNPRNIAAYTRNFSRLIPLTYRIDGSSRGQDALAWAADVASAARAQVTGDLTEHTEDVFRSARHDVAGKTVFTHSWATVAVMRAINSGLLPAPKALVVVNPPALTGLGTAEWRAFAEKHPDMPIDIYIGIDDPSQRTRIGLHDAGKRMSQGPFFDFKGPDLTPGDVISGFLTPVNPARITVRMYPGGHRLSTFFDFAARHHLNGIKAFPPAPSGAGLSLPALMPAFNGIFGPRGDLGAPVQPQPQSGYAFLAATQDGLMEAQKMARLQDMQSYGLTREQLLARAEAVRAQLHQTRWDVFQTITDTACETPYMLDEADAQGLLPTFSIPLADVTAGVAAHQKDLSACQQALIKAMLAKSATIPFAWIAQWGTNYRHEHSLTTQTKRFFKHVGSLIASGADAFLTALEAMVPDIPEGSGSDGGSGGSGRDRDTYGGSGGSSGISGGGEALGQAQTINITGSWGGN